MKKGVILYHNNIQKLYDNRWIDKCIHSMVNQTDNDFTFYELNYNGDSNSVVKNNSQKLKFWSKKMSNYAEAMNFLLDKSFNDGCDYVFNTNLDDYYALNRISSQLDMMLEQDLDIVSSDFSYIQERKENGISEDVVILFKNIEKNNIKDNLMKRHNVIAHPSVCYNKRFWLDNNNRYDINKVPQEDLDLWIRSINNGYKFGIHEKVLLYYRIHEKQSSQS
jgi:hypothetical protein